MARRALRPAEERALRRAIGAYFAFQSFAAANFFWPIFFVYYQRFGRLDVAAIFALQAFYTLARVVLEIPLGVLADRFGRRGALAASAGCMAAGCGIIVADPSLLAFYAAELFFAAAVAARSGADGALLFDTLAHFGQSDEYPRVEGRAQSLAAIVGAASAALSGFLVEWWLPLPYLCTLAAASATLGAAMLLDEAPGARAAQGMRGIARGALGEIVRAPAALWLIALYALLIVLSHVVFYAQQPYLESIGVPVALFGVVFAACKLAHAAAAHRAGAIEAALGARRVPAFLVAAALAPVALMSAIAHPLGVLLPPLRGIADGLLQPVVHFYLNRMVSPLRRASVLSIASFSARALQAAALWGLGAAIARLGLAPALGIVAGLGALAGGALLLLPRAARRAATDVPRAPLGTDAVAPPPSLDRD